MNNLNLIRFDPNQSAAADGGVESTIWYRDPTGDVRAGHWTASGGSALNLVNHPSEFCTLLEGVVRLCDLEGNAEVYGAGESFIIPAGFTGRWETVETCRKFFVIHQPSATETSE